MRLLKAGYQLIRYHITIKTKIIYLKPVPLGAVPVRVEGLSADVGLVRHTAELDLHEGIRGVTGPVHHGQVPTRQHFHLYFSRHFDLFSHT